MSVCRGWCSSLFVLNKTQIRNKSDGKLPWNGGMSVRRQPTASSHGGFVGVGNVFPPAEEL
jgi:hypothetical protein